MKKISKILILVLAVVMVFGVSSTAFAAEYGLNAGQEYFNGTVSYSYYTTNYLTKQAGWNLFQDGIWKHQLSNGTSVKYTSRMYLAGSTTARASDVVERAAGNYLDNGFTWLTGGVINYVNQTGSFRLKVDNTYYPGSPITFDGKWAICNTAGKGTPSD